VACRLKRTWRVPPKRIPPVGLTGEYTGGMLTFTNEDIWAKLASETGNDSSSIDFLPFSDVEASVKGDVRTIREKSLPSEGCRLDWLDLRHRYRAPARSGVARHEGGPCASGPREQGPGPKGREGPAKISCTDG
jgi:hypothetical protein